MTEPIKPQGKTARAVWAFIGTSMAAMCGLGAVGGYFGSLLGAPFYFGFFFVFALTGLSAMFYLAVQLERQYGPDRKER